MLPSTRRPKEVEEERAARAAEALKEERENSVVLHSSTVESILDGIIKWYSAMQDKEKRRLTPVALKRKIVNICYQFEFDYDMLPLDWIKTIKEECGLKLYERVRNEDDKNKSYSKEKKTQNGRKVFEENGTKRRRSSRDLSPGPSTSDKCVINSTQVIDVKSKVSAPSVKKFVDLSTEPPPPFWIQAYAKGVELPRILTVYSTEDTNILYYDYNPKLKDSSGKEIKLAPQPRNGESLIAKIFTKPSGNDKYSRRKSKKIIKPGSSSGRR